MLSSEDAGHTPPAHWSLCSTQRFALPKLRMLARGMFRAAAQAHHCRLAPAAVPALRQLHASAPLRMVEHDDFAPVSKVVPDGNILSQIEEVRAGTTAAPSRQ
jgi:hypothetical protein